MAEPRSVEFKVSTSGQLSLPSAARHRWGLMKGGPVDVIDVGPAVVITPAGSSGALLEDLVSSEDHHRFVAELGEDEDLATT